MTPEQAVAASRRSVQALGGAAPTCPKTLQRARELGLSGWAFTIAGRGGVLGEVRPELVAASLGLIAPDAVQAGWESARAIIPPVMVAAEVMTQVRRWGAENLQTTPRVERLAELAKRVVRAADPAGLPLFAAWRAASRPLADPAESAAVGLFLLREYGAGVFLMAARVGGLAPVEALISGRAGEAAAVAYGWQPPFPSPGPLARRRAWVDGATDRIVGRSYGVLTRPERLEWTTLVNAASGAVGPVRFSWAGDPTAPTSS
ncbi:hypothetical protein F4553_003770 [Allocatelliglobosispora scoriae]|uniref:Uncharacterized protein n=1 Tax=Allocatelliglobosispora scoriae TaxID=643052 RepID=A0A841BUG4_9ACTN|nr:hypothetical protein [Allocatelliglobosispora scoriae]MBB5870391.1 hypothetical protein [Allocatelliglobosispora scoriae]